MALPDINKVNYYLSKQKVLNNYIKEYYDDFPFSRFMGEGSNNIIVTKRQKRGDGDTIIFPLNQIFFDMNVRGVGEAITGTEQELTYAFDIVKLRENDWGMKLSYGDWYKLCFDLNFDNDLRNNLTAQANYLRTQRFIQALLLGMVPGSQRGGVLPLTALKTVEDTTLKTTILNSSIDALNAAGDGISKQRLMCGNDFVTNQATIGDAITHANFTLANGHGYTVKMLRKAIRLAHAGNRPTASPYKEQKLNPYKTNPARWGSREQMFVIVLSNYAYDQLCEDPMWRDQINRGVIENAARQPSLLEGGYFKGMIEGCPILVYHELDNFTFNNGTVAFGALLGACAMGYAMYDMPTLVVQNQDYNRERGIAHLETSGVSVLKFDSKSDPKLKGKNPLKVDCGVIYLFGKIA